MITRPRRWSIQAYVLEVFEEHPNQNLKRGYIRDQTIEKSKMRLSGVQIDGAISGLRNRGFRIFPTCPVIYGNLSARTFRLFTNVNEKPQDFSRKPWFVKITANDEADARRIAAALEKALNRQIEVRKV